MSKAAKQSIFILIILLVVSLGFAGYTLMQNNKLGDDLENSAAELDKAKARETKQLQDIKSLTDEAKIAKEDLNTLDKKLKDSEQRAKTLSTEVEGVSQDRDKWKARIDEMRKERDELLARIKDLTEQQVVKRPEEKEAETPGQETEMKMAQTEISPDRPAITIEGSKGDEVYWASVLKDKAALQVELDAMKKELSKKNVEVLEMQQKNAGLQLELDNINHDKDEIVREIKFKEEMVNNLSLELARTRNDKKFVADRVEELNKENGELRSQLKKLVQTKGSLEKTIARLAEEKGSIEKKLGQTESLIQSKIDEIWEIKESLDQSIKSAQVTKPIGSTEVELPPIVVSSGGPAVSFNTGETTPGFDGKVVSLNKENNFAIVDIGEVAGLRLGDVLSVYRESQYIARLEVIQVRRDIAAADIKEQWANIQVGDVVK